MICLGCMNKMETQIYTQKIESHPVFAEFLKSNRLSFVCLDFQQRTGVYAIAGSGKRFTGIELMTAFAGFSKGYLNCKKYNKHGEVSIPKKQDKTSAELETLLLNEISILELIKSKRDIGVSEEICLGALNSTREAICKQQYLFGTMANTLNESGGEIKMETQQINTHELYANLPIGTKAHLAENPDSYGSFRYRNGSFSCLKFAILCQDRKNHRYTWHIHCDEIGLNEIFAPWSREILVEPRISKLRHGRKLRCLEVVDEYGQHYFLKQEGKQEG